MGERGTHWDGVYRERTAEGMSWHQSRPEPSLTLLTEALPDPRSRVVDVGGGESLLVDRLLDLGYRRPAILDVSAVALERARQRLGPRADEVEWIRSDVTRWEPDGIWDGWHDRAVLHFLVDEGDRKRYRRVLDRATGPGSVAVIATFGPEGPTRCSGLPCVRYSSGEIEEWLGDRWRLEGSALVEHRTPWDAPQQFLFATLRKRDEAPG